MSIITRTSSNVHVSEGINTWQDELKSMFRTLEELCSYLELEIENLPLTEQAARQFPVRVTRSFVDRMQKGDPNDPLLLQVLPQSIELAVSPSYSKDPLQEVQANPIEGLVHKYHGRVLIITSGSCAINCRYCFRRHFPYEDNRLSEENLKAIITYIDSDETINEVILSGGEPLINSDFALRRLLVALEQVPHVNTIRFHTRMPIVLPERINTQFVEMLKAFRFRFVMVIHANHANELSQGVANAMRLLASSGVNLLNQSVFLKGVNNSVAALKALHEGLFSMQVMPYYMHVLDNVEGAEHFNVTDTESIVLFSQLQKIQPGYLLPRLVKEIPGHTSKTMIHYF